MRLQLSVLSAIVLTGMVCLAQNPRPKPKVSGQPLTPEQVAVYRTVLKNYLLKHSGDVLNVADTTEPLKRTGPVFDRTGPVFGYCMAGVELDRPGSSAPVVHKLSQSVLIDPRIILVEPEQQNARIKQNDPQKVVRQAKAHGKTVTAAEVEKFEKVAEANGMLSLSEISFDKTHSHAVVTYSFVCGEDCGDGRIFVLEKVGDEWKLIRGCLLWRMVDCLIAPITLSRVQAS